MPITKAAKKALRQNEKRRKRNRKKRDKLNATIKEIEKMIEGGKLKEAKKLLPETYKALDKAAKSGLIKKNTADRKKSRLTKQINKES
ncbi:MAG: 30S ribosomal protein S20 [Candidatus Nealsonbacteria bacterium]|nr:30S ribosomal protein S20 [Candidatus Nealsonbacteria bacterium]